MSGRAAGLVRLWVRLYTRGLPAEVAARRVDEIESDVWDQIEEASLAGQSPREMNAEILLRLLAGIPADLAWRLERGAGGQLTPSEPIATTRATRATRAVAVLAVLGGLDLVTFAGFL